MKQLQDDRGQALFEFLVFLPVMVLLYSITLTIGNSINGSINQQKFTRGYFFNVIHNDSNLPTTPTLMQMKGRLVGMFAIGWKMDETSGQTPVAPCFRMFSLTNDPTSPGVEECNPGGGGIRAPYIRVKTVFGVCTETYINNNGQWHRAINVGSPVAHPGSCQITN
ncbi:MAG: hypothetical protein HQK50_04295 [Oligoflexia bacterium]|nr:hypothetical protein [Oligoflexia bacterium]MBF0364765.1 hypothetical protein [Oligoflexia bacterium]